MENRKQATTKTLALDTLFPTHAPSARAWIGHPKILGGFGKATARTSNSKNGRQQVRSLRSEWKIKYKKKGKGKGKGVCRFAPSANTEVLHCAQDEGDFFGGCVVFGSD
jgi:hypothetical protein